MTFIITKADYGSFNTKGVTASQVLGRAGDAMKNGGLPTSSVLALQQQGQPTRSEHFAKTGDASARGTQRTASDIGAMTGGAWAGSQISYTAPTFYSPLHTATNWQIPTKRREVYIWARFFAQNDPTIKSSLRFYSQFPFHGYEHVIPDPIRKEHFDNLKKRLRLEHLLPQLAYEYFTMGDAFPFISFQCETCGGFGTTQDGEVCNHEGGRIANVTVMNPDWIDVQINPLMPNDPVINLIPDDTLKQIVWSKKPPEIYDKIPAKLRDLIMKQQPIPISNRAITHLKHDEVPYMAYGNSIIAPIFPILAYQDRLRQAQWIVAERHILPIKVCKVGSDTRPASSADIADTQRQLAMSANDPNLTLVTHHSFDFEWVGAAGKVLQLTKEYELIDKCLIKGLGVNEALLSGEGPSYSQAAIGIEATIKRLKTVQSMMAEWICEKIYRVEAMMQGFYKKDLSGNQVLDYPQIRWADLNLRDETQKQQLYMQMWDKQLVSTQFIHEKFEIDHETEVERVRMEQAYQMQLGIAPPGGEGGGAGGAGGLGGGKPGAGGLGGGFKGNLPGGQSGPGLPGDANAPSMSGGAPPPGGAAPPPGPQASYETQMRNFNQAQQYSPSVTRKSRIKEPKKPIEPKPDLMVEGGEMLEVPRTGALSLTDIEMTLYSKVEEAQKQGLLPLEFLWQQNPEPNDPDTSRITADGMFPAIRLLVEADGKKWHSSPEDMQRDAERDNKLIARGWSILRFTEDEIKFSIENVIQKIIRSAEEMGGMDQETDVERVAMQCFASGGYSSDLSYSEKINKYKQEELAYRMVKEAQKNKEPEVKKQKEVIAEQTVETLPEIKAEEIVEKSSKLKETNTGHDLTEKQEKIVDEGFLNTAQTYDGEETKKVDEVISEDLSSGEEEIIPEQDGLQDLIN